MSERSEVLGKDLRLVFGESGADLSPTSEGDLETVSGELNLAQAIIARLTTGIGELYDTGHANYGSRLHELIGEPNDTRTRERVKNVVSDCLAHEPRIREIVAVSVRSNLSDLHRLDLEVTVLPAENSTPLSIVYPFHLEAG